jgi:hypothetical protein
MSVRPSGKRSASFGATIDVAPGTLDPSPKVQTMLPWRVISMTRLLY